VLPETPYDISTDMSFDKMVSPGPKSVIGSLSSESLSFLCELYSKLYPTYGSEFSACNVPIPSGRCNSRNTE